MMKLHTCTLWALLLGNVLSLQAQGVTFRNVSWSELKQQAQAEKKAIFVDVYTSWCGPCKKMDRDVFSKAEVGSYMNSKFVSAHVDAERQKDFGLFAKYTPSSFPTFYWLDAEGNLLDVESGFLPAEDFLKQSEKALRNTIGVRYQTLQKRWNEGDRSPRFVKEFVLDVMPKIHVDSVRTYMNRYLENLETNELRTKEVGKMVILFPQKVVDDAVWRTFVGNNDEYTRLFGYEYWKKLYMNLVRVPMAGRGDKQQQAEVLRCIDHINFPEKQLFADLRAIEKDIFAHRYGSALKQSLAIGKANENRLPYIYMEMFYTYIIGDFFSAAYKPSKAELTDIAELGEKAFQLYPCQCSLMYLAASQARCGDYKSAYESLASLPFYKEPVLSSAVYKMLNLKRIKPNK